MKSKHKTSPCYFFKQATDYYKIPRKLKKKCKLELIKDNAFTSKECRVICYTRNFRNSGTSRVTSFSL